MRGAASVAALCLLLGGCGSGGGDAAPARAVGTEVGQQAPALSGATADGEAFALRDLGGSRVVLVFYQGAYCGLCRDRLARLQEHLAAYGELGAEVVALSPDPSERSAELAAQLGLQFPLVRVDTAALRQWGAAEPGGDHSRPATFVLGEDGEVRFRHLGRNAGDRVPDAALLALLQQAAAP